MTMKGIFLWAFASLAALARVSAGVTGGIGDVRLSGEFGARLDRMIDCTQAFEVWCKKAPKGMGFENYSFTGNRTLRVGGGWGVLSRPNRLVATPLLVYAMETDTVDIDVRGNVFEDAPRGLIYKSGGLETLPAGYRFNR